MSETRYTITALGRLTLAYMDARDRFGPESPRTLAAARRMEDAHQELEAADACPEWSCWWCGGSYLPDSTDQAASGYCSVECDLAAQEATRLSGRWF